MPRNSSRCRKPRIATRSSASRRRRQRSAPDCGRCAPIYGSSSPTTMWSSSFTLPHRPLPHFGAAPEELLKELVAKALFNKGVRLGELGRTEDEIAVYEDLVARFGIAPQLPLRERVAS